MPAINYKDLKKNNLPKVGGMGSTSQTTPDIYDPFKKNTSSAALDTPPVGMPKIAAPPPPVQQVSPPPMQQTEQPAPPPPKGYTPQEIAAINAAREEKGLPQAALESVTQKAVDAPTSLPPALPTTALDKPIGYDTTALGEQALDQYSKYALGDEDPQVTAERERLERNKVLQSSQAKRTAHERAVQSGFMPGSPQYEQMMNQATTAASNANIQAENAFNDFSRARRRDRQGEIENILGGEFSRVGSQQSLDFRNFNQLVKFLPSDKAQQMLSIADSQGMNLSTTIQNMYSPDGTLKPEFKDLSKPELIKEGMKQSVDQMANNPETGNAWSGTEKEDYVNKFYDDNFKNILYPAETQTGQIEEKEASKSRVQDALDSGDYSKMDQTDWANMTNTQIVDAKAAGHIVDYDSSLQKGDDWSDLDNMNTSDATSKWLSRNPISAPENKGKIIDIDGVLYEITEPMKTVDLGGDNKRISVMARPVKGGPEKSILNSSRFEGTTAGFLGGLF